MIGSWCFQLSTRVVYGRHAAKGLGQIATGCGIHKAMVVTDAGVVRFGVVDQGLTPLREAGIVALVFDEVEANPTLRTVDRATSQFLEAGCDGVVAVGGGSALDAGKAVGVLATNPGPAADYLGSGRVKNPAVPVICLPTTAGTGTEVTDAAALRNEEKGVKAGIRSPFVPPRVGLLDPLLTLSLPPGLTRDTGMDALTHAIESYINVEAWDGSRALALRAIHLIGRHLRTAVDDGTDLEARDGMLTASLLAGVAFQNTNLGLVHAISTTLGGAYNTPHGTTNAMILPHAMRFLMPVAPLDFVDIAAALGERVEGLSTRDAAELAIEAVLGLSRDTGLRGGLSTLGVHAQGVAALAETMATTRWRPCRPAEPRSGRSWRSAKPRSERRGAGMKLIGRHARQTRASRGYKKPRSRLPRSGLWSGRRW